MEPTNWNLKQSIGHPYGCIRSGSFIFFFVLYRCQNRRINWISNPSNHTLPTIPADNRSKTLLHHSRSIYRIDRKRRRRSAFTWERRAIPECRNSTSIDRPMSNRLISLLRTRQWNSYIWRHAFGRPTQAEPHHALGSVGFLFGREVVQSLSFTFSLFYHSLGQPPFATDQIAFSISCVQIGLILFFFIFSTQTHYNFARLH